MENKKHLLPLVNQYFKANLHTHSTISDGKMTREEVKKAYKALGYQILCLTDHNTIANHSDMNEPDFLMLTGAEIDITAPSTNNSDAQTYHLNLIAKEPDNLWYPANVKCWFPKVEKYESKIQYDNMDLKYNTDSVNTMIAKANKKAFLLCITIPPGPCRAIRTMHR